MKASSFLWWNDDCPTSVSMGYIEREREILLWESDKLFLTCDNEDFD